MTKYFVTILTYFLSPIIYFVTNSCWKTNDVNNISEEKLSSPIMTIIWQNISSPFYIYLSPIIRFTTNNWWKISLNVRKLSSPNSDCFMTKQFVTNFFFKKTSSAIEKFVIYNTFMRRLMTKKIIHNTSLGI